MKILVLITPHSAAGLLGLTLHAGLPTFIASAIKQEELHCSQISVALFPQKKTISGYTTIHFLSKRYRVIVSQYGDSCSLTLPDSATITLTATPAFGSSFTGWSGACSGFGECVVQMDPARTVDATFIRNSYGMNVGSVGSGTVAQLPDQATHPFGDGVTLTAMPAIGWSFTGWSGDSASLDNPLSVVVTATNLYTANFAVNSYAVDLSAEGSGDVQKSPDQVTYTFGEPVTLTATPAPYWNFVGWSGNSTSQDNPLSVVIATSNQYTANFVIDAYKVDVTVVGNGSVQKSPDQTLYGFGTQVTLTAVPAIEAWMFVNWSGDNVSDTAPSVVLTVGMENQVQATFRELDVPMAVNDAFTTRPNTTILGDLLTNDHDPEGGNLRIDSLVDTENGSASVDEEGNFNYTAHIDFVGIDTLAYSVVNEVGRRATAQIFVVVEEAAPTGFQPVLFFPSSDQPTTQVVETGGMSLTIQAPAGYLGNVLTPQEIFYYVCSPIPGVNLPGTVPTLNFAGLYFSLDAFVNGTPLEHPTFDPPLRMTIIYPDRAVGEGVESVMTLRYWDADANTWSQAGISLVEHDVETNRIVLDIAHLSEYALFVGQAPTNLPPGGQPGDNSVHTYLPSVLD